MTLCSDKRSSKFGFKLVSNFFTPLVILGFLAFLLFGKDIQEQTET